MEPRWAHDPTTAFRLPSPGPLRASALRLVARLLSEFPPGTGVLLEERSDRPDLIAIPSSRPLARALGAVGRPHPSAIAAVSPPPFGPPREFELRAVGRWKAGALPASASPLPGPPFAPGGVRPGVDLPLDLGERLWLGRQRHWFSAGSGQLWTRERFLFATRGPERPMDRAVASLAALPGRGRPDGPGWMRWRRTGPRRAHHLFSGRLGFVERCFGERTPAEGAADDGFPFATRWTEFPSDVDLLRNVVVLGASGSGKTRFLARRAGSWVRRGGAVFLLDLHGDLAPAVVAELGAAERPRLVAIDASADAGPGVPILDGAGVRDDREVGVLVAALKRLSGEGPELYWGYRIERVFETLIRLVQEEGGNLVDLYDLLTDERRREASRLRTTEPAIARFLEEIPPILRRNPEYLASAAARLARVVLHPALRRLLAPAAGDAVPVGELLAAGRSVAIRIPSGTLGPEAASFAASLLLTRVYLDRTRPVPHLGPPVVVLLDEVHALAPRLVAEILADGRKFAVAVLAATQYPHRLAPEVREAAAGAVGSHVAFRVPAPASRVASEWVGLPAVSGPATVEGLPVGGAIASAASGGPPRFLLEPVPPAPDVAGWNGSVKASRDEFATSTGTPEGPPAPPVEEAILLALYSAPGPVPVPDLARTVSLRASVPGPALLERLAGLRSRGWVAETAAGVSITPAGGAALGASAEHGSTSEGFEHRRLLLAAFRIFAARGEHLELVRQGRFDTRLPDARLRLLPATALELSPVELAGSIEARRRSWAWRYFGGRDVHVEAEVSGALRPERVRRGYRKGERNRAFVLFLVGDERRRAKVRVTLERMGAARDRWAVWVLLPPGTREGHEAPGAPGAESCARSFPSTFPDRRSPS